jgi:hypothetical protein
MPDNIVLLVALVLPIVAMTILRVNAVMVFLGLCLGEVLVTFVGDDSSVMLNLFSSQRPSELSQSTLRLALLLAPAILTAVFTLFSIKGRGRVLLNIVPAAGAAFLGLVLAVPELSPGARTSIQNGQTWQQLTQAQAMIIGVSALVSLLFFWLQRRSGGHHSKASR